MISLKLGSVAAEFPQKRDMINDCDAQGPMLQQNAVGARGNESLAADTLAGQRIDQIAIDVELIRAGSRHPADQHVVVAGRLPVRGVHIRRARGRREHVMALHRSKAAAALQIVLNHAGQIQSRIGRHGAPERYDRDRNGIGHALRDVDLQLSACRCCCQHKDGQDGAACQGSNGSMSWMSIHWEQR